MDLEQDLQEAGVLKDKPDYQILLNELRISCTMAMLLCLNSAHRMAYILGDILELDHDEASKALSISKDNFRKQLSRARGKVVRFTNDSCGLVNNCSNCSCDKKLSGAIERKRISSDTMYFADKTDYSYIELKDVLNDTQQELKALTLQKSAVHSKCPNALSEIIGSLVNERLSVNKAFH